MRIAIIGTGYVGLVSGACLADFGHNVVCVDQDSAKIESLKQGSVPIFEPGLEELVARNVAAGRLAFSTSVALGVAGAEAVFIAVGTPSRRGDGHADLRHVLAAAAEIACALTGPAAVVMKSTVPVGTGDEVARIIRQVAPHAEAWVVSNPEFLRQGDAIEDFKRPDRIVVGTGDPPAAEIMRAVYRPICLDGAPLLFTGRSTAELIKYAANAYLATRITFINEIADLCEAVGADVQDVARGVGLDHRIGPNYLRAGPGFGGSCFPKDSIALLKTAQDRHVALSVVDAVVQANATRKREMGRRIVRALGDHASGKVVALLGLTFKPNTDDMREAPSISIVEMLEDAGVSVRAYDPAGMDHATPLMPNVTFCSGPYEAAEGADAVVLVTEWDALRALDLGRLAASMTSRILFDLHNVYRPEEARKAGFAWHGVGKPAAPG